MTPLILPGGEGVLAPHSGHGDRTSVFGLLRRLKGRGAVRHGEQGAAEGPDVDRFGQGDARLDLRREEAACSE